jgi:hypothetical protein
MNTKTSDAQLRDSYAQIINNKTFVALVRDAVPNRTESFDGEAFLQRMERNVAQRNQAAQTSDVTLPS